MSSGVQREIRSTVRATGAALPVRTVGFRPGRVRLWNETTGYQLEWLEGMADDSAVQTTDAGARTIVTSDGITPLSDGFQVGALADVNDTTTEQLRYLASE